MNRRSFLKGSMLTTAALSLPARSWLNAAGANERINVGIVGIGGRGRNHISGMRGLRDKGVRIAALCDVDTHYLSREAEAAGEKGDNVETFVDIRRMLEQKDLDVITIATPNHWHALASIWSVQAGKDVYVEKPVSHNVWEGRKIVEAARKYNKIVQTGTQCRSSTGIAEAVAWVQAGNLGKILVSRGLCYKPRRSIGKVDGPQPVPEHIDYDLWCGPAPKKPVMRERFHYDWHWIWDYGNGDLGNQGIHQMDIARWFLGEDALSPRVFSVGGRLGYVDDGETPNTQFVCHDYESAPLIFEVRGLPEKEGASQMDTYMGGRVAAIIHCEGGHILVPNYSTAIAYDKSGKEIKKWQGANDHYDNFISAVRSRKHEDLAADILEGHLSSALCHTGNVSYLMGQKAAPAKIREEIKGDKEALETYNRMADHLAANNINIEQDHLTLGPVLRMNPRRERFRRNREANALLTRDYREPYVVPENV